MFQRPQLQTGEEERLPGSLQQGDWPRALRTVELSVWLEKVAVEAEGWRSKNPNCGLTHHNVEAVSFVAAQRRTR